MSRVGKKPVELPNGITAEVAGQILKIKGPKGELVLDIHPDIRSEIQQDESSGKKIKIEIVDTENSGTRSLWGLTRNLVQNMVHGVEYGFSKQLEVIGIGYRVAMSGKTLELELGFSHPVKFELPAGIEAKVEKNIITISGIDKQLVGEAAARIRSIKKPEPYKGKGIKYIDEIIRRKAGKAVKTGA